jgi:hypothetical protein
MGRRFWLILGMMLLAPPALPSARAQGDGGPPTLEPAPAAPSDTPLPTKPIDLRTPDDFPTSAESPRPDSRKTAQPEKARSQQEGREGNAFDRPAPGDLPGVPTLSPAPAV